MKFEKSAPQPQNPEHGLSSEALHALGSLAAPAAEQEAFNSLTRLGDKSWEPFANSVEEQIKDYFAAFGHLRIKRHAEGLTQRVNAQMTSEMRDLFDSEVLAPKLIMCPPITFHTMLSKYASINWTKQEDALHIPDGPVISGYSYVDHYAKKWLVGFEYPFKMRSSDFLGDIIAFAHKKKGFLKHRPSLDMQIMGPREYLIKSAADRIAGINPLDYADSATIFPECIEPKTPADSSPAEVLIAQHQASKRLRFANTSMQYPRRELFYRTIVSVRPEA